MNIHRRMSYSDEKLIAERAEHSGKRSIPLWQDTGNLSADIVFSVIMFPWFVITLASDAVTDFLETEKAPKKPKPFLLDVSLITFRVFLHGAVLYAVSGLRWQRPRFSL